MKEQTKAYPVPEERQVTHPEGDRIGFRHKLIEWFGREGRQLPWRETTDPYRIWLSEVILQQTQVKQGWDYYLRFTEQYPTVADLARAPEDDVLLLWQGLGYYSRALNLHAAAKQIMQEHGGIFPRETKAVQALKGVGPYTTAAIMSIAYNEPLAVLDGNVFRILSRVEASDVPIDTTGGRKYYQALADQYLDHQRPSKYNQAIMDLGAMICKPRQPLCEACPVAPFCASKGNQELITKLPIKSRSIPVTPIYMDYLLWLHGDGFYIEERSKEGIWKGLYQLPLRESTDAHCTQEELTQWIASYEETPTVAQEEAYSTLLESMELPPHRLTHRLLHIRVHMVESTSPLPAPFQLIQKSQHDTYAFPKPLRAFLDRFLA